MEGSPADEVSKALPFPTKEMIKQLKAMNRQFYNLFSAALVSKALPFPTKEMACR